MIRRLLATLALTVVVAGCGSTAVPPVEPGTAGEPHSMTPRQERLTPLAARSSATVPGSALASPTGTPSLSQHFCMPVEDLCFDYPAGWTFASEAVPGEPDHYMMLLRNADGALVYYFATVQASQRDEDPCAGAILPKTVLTVTPSRLSGYASPGNADQAQVVTSVTRWAEHRYLPSIMLTTSDPYLTVGTNDVCVFAAATLPSRVRPATYLAFGDRRWMPRPISVNTDRNFPTQEEAIAALQNSPDVPVIVAILASAHYR